MIQESLVILRRQFLGLSRILSTITELVSGAVEQRNETSLIEFAADLLLHNHNFQSVTIHEIVNGDIVLRCAQSTQSLFRPETDEEAQPYAHTSALIARQHLRKGSEPIISREVADTFYYSAAIVHQAQMIGIITVNAPSFDENHAKFLPVFATTLASMLLNVRYGIRLNKDVQRRSEELESAWDSAKKSDAARSKFLSNVSHEYLTPLNAINSASTLLAETDLSAEQQEFVRTILQSTRKLSGMVGGTLDYVLSETGPVARTAKTVNLPQLLQVLLTQAERLNTNPELSFRLEAAQNLPVVEVDEQRLSQILNHLIGNAVKFTPQGTVVLEVQLVKQTGIMAEIRLAVTDTGIGIADHQQEVIFSAFHQLDDSSTRPYEGAGLGLALCQRMAQMLGSEIKVHSVPGVGSTFSLNIWMPVRDAVITSSPGTSDQQAISPAAIVQSAEASNIPNSSSALSVLLVEDNLINQKLAARLLEKMGCRVDIANDGVDAVNKFSESAYDLVFMDCQMPNMDGFEATSRIREIESGQRTPIIALTANCLPEDRDRSFRVGMDEFLTKPVVKEELRKTLSRWSATQPPN